MPTYPVKHKETPEWDKDWSQGCAGSGEVGDWRDKMNKTHPGWGDIMRNKVYKVPGAVNDGYKF